MQERIPHPLPKSLGMGNLLTNEQFAEVRVRSANSHLHDPGGHAEHLCEAD